MAKNTVQDWDTNADLNLDVAGISIAEGWAPSSVNNSIRAMMAQLAAFFKTAIALATGSTVVDPTGVARLIGYADVPLIDLAAAYTLVLADRGIARRLITGSGTVTIPLNATAAFPIGSIVGFYNHTAATKSIAATSGVTLRLHGTATTGTRTIAVRGWAFLTKIDSDEWSAQGDVT